MAPTSPRAVPPARVALAWSVHAFTASGAVVGAFALLAIAAGELSHAALLMLAALAIDSVDGALARRVEVARVLPDFDGRRLDDMVDYFNYVIVPVMFAVAAGSLAHWSWVALPILASAYGFSHTAAKTDDAFFLGWPSYWNVVVLYLWLLGISPAVGTAVVVLFAALIFVPLKYVYPSRTPRLRGLTLGLAAVWILTLAVCVLVRGAGGVSPWVLLSLAFPAYYVALSFWVGGLHRRSA